MIINELLQMFIQEFEKDQETFKSLKFEIFQAQNKERLEDSIQTYILNIQRVCEGASALGLNGLYLYFQQVIVNLYEAKAFEASDQMLIESLYDEWFPLSIKYLNEIQENKDVTDSVNQILELLNPPNALIELSEELKSQLINGLTTKFDIDEKISELLHSVEEDNNSMFLFEEDKLEIKKNNFEDLNLDILFQESKENIDIIKENLNEISSFDIILLKDYKPEEFNKAIKNCKRAAHTIKGSSQMVELHALGVLMHKVEYLFDFIETDKFNLDYLNNNVVLSSLNNIIKDSEAIIDSFLYNSEMPKKEELLENLTIFLSIFKKIYNSEIIEATKIQKIEENIVENQDLILNNLNENIIIKENEDKVLDIKLVTENKIEENIVEIKNVEKIESKLVKKENKAKEDRRKINNVLSNADNIFELVGNSQIKINYIKTQNLDLMSYVKIIEEENEILNFKLDKLSKFVTSYLLENKNLDSLEKRNYTEVYSQAVSINETNNNIKVILQNFFSKSNTLKREIELIENNEKNISNLILKQKMVSFEQLVSRLERVVDSASKLINKKVNFNIEGISTNIEKNILEKLYEPLMHLLRNAVDHGIENNGNIELKISAWGNKIKIELIDYGKGLDKDKILQKAQEKNLINQLNINNLVDKDIFQFIFLNGFSTKSEVTELSGRGVGLDIVQKEIEKLRGTIEVNSLKNKFTNFTIVIPSNLSSVNCLVLKNNDTYLAIPTNYIDLILDYKSYEVIEGFDNQEKQITFNYNGYKKYLKLLDFTQFSTLSKRIYSSTEEEKNKVLILKCLGNEFAVKVDEVLFIEDVIVRKIKNIGSANKLMLGATILLNGDIVPILNIAELYKNKHDLIDLNESTINVNNSTINVLCVDDSLFIRTFLEKVIINLGLNPILATNGLEAISKIKKHNINLILTDLEMPEMDGFEFVSFVKNNELYKNIPTFMITSRNTEKYHEKAKELNVAEFITKPFEAKILENLITKYLNIKL